MEEFNYKMTAKDEMKRKDKQRQNVGSKMNNTHEMHLLDQQLAALSEGIQLHPSDEFTNRVIQGISSPPAVQIHWLETPMRAAAAILIFATLIGLNAFSLRSISTLTDNSTPLSDQELMENEFTMEYLGWLSADYPQLVSEE